MFHLAAFRIMLFRRYPSFLLAAQRFRQGSDPKPSGSKAIRRRSATMTASPLTVDDADFTWIIAGLELRFTAKP